MESFDGPHFTPDLIGPDGRLTRLHKGGRHKANALAKEAQVQQASIAKRQQQEAARIAAAQQAQAARENALRQQELAQSEQLLTKMGESSPATQYIKDAPKRRRSAFGLASTRGANAFGLGGGGGSTLG